MPAHGRKQVQIPQRLPGEQLGALLALEPIEPPTILLENNDIFFLTSGLSQDGQVTEETAEMLRTNLSKLSPQFAQTNS